MSQEKSPTLFERIWDNHVVVQEPDVPSILYIDLHLIHEVTSPQAFDGLRARGLQVHSTQRTFATMDHSVPTVGKDYGRMSVADAMAKTQIEKMRANCAEFGLNLFGLDHENQGIVHIIGPELGLTQPGMTIVCGDSHTATHGAFGALAFGIGTTEVEHVLATQTLLQYKPTSCEVRMQGKRQPGVQSKDLILALIAQIGVGGGTGSVFEYSGNAVREMTMEERMTMCNMSIEAGARAGMVAPDDTTYAYLHGKPYAPHGAEWDKALVKWKALAAEPRDGFDKTIDLDVNLIEPMVTFGTNPSMGIPISSSIPDPDAIGDATQKRALEKSLAYMGLPAGQPILGSRIDTVFIGSCTNGRLEDLEAAAKLLRGKKKSPSVRLLVVPGSHAVKKAAETKGLDQIFLQAGAEWREPGCSMCVAMNGDQLSPGEYAVSTSNRNFEGRQGIGGRTFLASPYTAAASAIEGAVADPRKYLED